MSFSVSDLQAGVCGPQRLIRVVLISSLVLITLNRSQLFLYTSDIKFLHDNDNIAC